MSETESFKKITLLIHELYVAVKPRKLEILNELQDWLYERYLRQSGEETVIADALLAFLHAEPDIEIVGEVLDALSNLTEGMYLPNARWKLLVDRLADLKTAQKKVFALTLLAKSLNSRFLSTLYAYGQDADPGVAVTAKESAHEIEAFLAKKRLAERLRITMQPCISTPLNDAVWKGICKELLPIFNFELQLGNEVERIDRNAWSNMDFVVVFKCPLFYELSELHHALPPSVQYRVNKDPHYALESCYFVKEKRQALSGPSR